MTNNSAPQPATLDNHDLGARLPNRGYIALISAILIAAVLILFVIAVSAAGFFGRFNIVDSELKEVSTGLAEACVDTAILKFVQDNTYTGPETVSVGGRACEIVSVEHPPTGGQATIKAQGVYKNSYTNLQVIINETNPYSVVSWEEKPSF